MSDETARPESTPESAPEAASAPVPPAPPAFVPPQYAPGYPVPPQPSPARSRRGTALKAAAVLVAVAVLGTYGYVVQKDKHHDRAGGDRPGATWTEPTPTATKAFGAKSGGSHYGRLSLLLLPMPDDYGPGPDVGAYGNDVELTAGQASALVKDDADLGAKERKDVDTAVDALHIEGAGLRTYQQHDNELIVQMTLIQMKNKRAAQAETTYFRAFTKALGIFRSGPKVAGHPQAVCMLPRAGKDEKLDAMFCEATEGDLMVKMTATGTAPLDKAAAADLLRRQLDRIKDPGESV